ncbi:MAG: glycosyltransferase [Candidatus Hydrogenedens sp.]|nr:glycosyltransferase [Candidatus Hydrogenedens sp.]
MAARVAEAAALHDAGRHDAAFDILSQLPDVLPPRFPHVELEAAVLGQRVLAAMADDPRYEPHATSLFFKAQGRFFRASYIDPIHPEANALQAAHWRRIGRADRARALERTHALATGKPLPEPLPTVTVAQSVPAYTGYRPRVLWLMNPAYDPGADVLYDGLCRALGKERVEEWPYKPMLHGQDREKAEYYPTVFEYPGEPRDLEWICAQLRAGAFDLVLYGDVLDTIPPEALARIAEAAGETPWCLLDLWDDAGDYQRAFIDRIGLRAALAYFKREMIAGCRYGDNTVPLPLSYPEGLAASAAGEPRPEAVFWTGNRFYGQRRLYLECLEQSVQGDFGRRLDQQAYRDALRRANIGVSLLGFGFDTVRYYEVPCNGGMLLAEQPPIVIPHDFTSGENALHFRDLQEFNEQLAWCFSHPNEVLALAARGHQHAMAYHTGTARARQMLAAIEQRLDAR